MNLTLQIETENKIFHFYLNVNIDNLLLIENQLKSYMFSLKYVFDFFLKLFLSGLFL